MKWSSTPLKQPLKPDPRMLCQVSGPSFDNNRLATFCPFIQPFLDLAGLPIPLSNLENKLDCDSLEPVTLSLAYLVNPRFWMLFEDLRIENKLSSGSSVQPRTFARFVKLVRSNEK